MIKHIVFFKLENSSEDQKKAVKERLMSLKENVEVLKHIEVGINFSNEDRAYDLALLTDFESEEDLGIYAKDPYHQEVIAYIKSVATSSKVVDYKY
jgi:hypothetical protein